MKLIIQNNYRFLRLFLEFHKKAKSRYPSGLIKALKKIKEENSPEKKISKAVAPLFFANPFKNLGSTHPPIDKRIETLERM